jgi:hypothetical protein
MGGGQPQEVVPTSTTLGEQGKPWTRALQARQMAAKKKIK